ncbi:inactive histone-lysine N-methyltransferase 2E-like isoform X3 [Asterias rubens]|uniref:inactive histone-lysine N-methyltransferase 2E-like isoform X3 n=1 Tax=Asterias rubens TaxID=7604 RepID=UPI00145561D6|nr:inactive histone-lysine N-methyltransferase 2E-like isoform X3 [Asterias rubens]
MSNVPYDGALTDKNYAAMAAGSDPEPVEEPVATGDVISHPTHTAQTTTGHYFGLPYQDHNYGAPPPPTPPESPSPEPLLSPVPAKINGIFDEPIKLEVKVTASPEQVESKDEGVTRCICNFEHDDGYMICCDGCCVWQHVDCMGLERDSIPETFFCERCQPREVDSQRAIELQSKKRAAMSDDSSSDSGDEVPVVTVGSAATYTAISNSPTSLTLTTHNKNKKMKKKKKKRCRDKEDDKHHKKKKKRHGKKCNKSDEITAPEELNVMDEETMPAWNDSREIHDRYEEAVCNQNSADIQHIISSHGKGLKPDPSSPFLFGMPRPTNPQVDLSRLGKGATVAGLVASDNLRSNDFIVEYWGKVMLKEQLEVEKTFFKRPYPYVLFYSKFNNVDICVDARNYGNVARFVRRSCSPNAEVRHYVENSNLHFCLFALLNIAKNTEVTIEFDFNYTESPYPVHCACAKKNCMVKRHFRKQNHQTTKAKNHLGNHLEDTTSLSVSSSFTRKRTVSPLRVSLSAHNAQNQAELPVTTNGDDSTHHDPINPEAPPTLCNSNPAQPLEAEGSEENQEDKKPTSAAKKMTREERKMEAILQAFARMEKTEKRRKEAQEKTSSTKPMTTTTSTVTTTVAETIVSTETKTLMSATVKEENPEESRASVDATEEVVVKEEPAASPTREEATAVEVLALDVSASATVPSVLTPVTTAPVLTPVAATRTKTFKGRKRKGSRRRSRANSGASSVSLDMSSLDEESNPAPGPQSVSLPPAAPNQTSLLIQMTLNSPVHGADQQGMASPIPACSKHFKFPKTKKFFMNEWLNEKALEASANKPLTIKTEPSEILTSSNSSPGSSLQLSKPSTLWALNASISKEVKTNLEASFGSAKKRWLRQAMSESSGPVPKAQSNNNNTNGGSDSPICNGTLSPNPASYPVSPALSPNTSGINDMMTPLKKRMLRHSIAEDRLTTTPPPANVLLDDKLRSQSTPSTPVVADDTLQQSGADSVSTTDSPRKSESGADGLATPSTPVQAEDFRKSSSVDSGLSVSTPADLDRSPLPLLPGEQPLSTANNLLHKDEGTPVKDELFMTELNKSRIPEERNFDANSVGDYNSQRQLESSTTPSQEQRQDSYKLTSSMDAKTDQVAVLSSSEKMEAPNGFDKAESGLPSASDGPIEKDPLMKLDFSLTASQGSLTSSLQSSQSDLQKSYMSLPDLGRSRTSLQDMSRSASSAELQMSSVARKLDLKSDLYSTQRYSEEPASNQTLLGEVSHRMRNLSGCSGSSSMDQTDGQLPLRQNFAEDQISGNLFSSFASPIKRPPLGQSPDNSNVELMQTIVPRYNQSSAAPVGDDLNSVPLDQLERRDVKQTYSQPLDGPNASDSEAPVKDTHVRVPMWGLAPNTASSTGPGRPPAVQVLPPGQGPLPSGVEGQTIESIEQGSAGYRPVGCTPGHPVPLSEGHVGVHAEPGQMGPGMPFPGQATQDVPQSPVKVPFGPGLVGTPGTPPASVSPVMGTSPAVKKRVSLLEYRKRKGSDLVNSKSSSPTSAPSTPVATKPSLSLKPPLPSPISASNPCTPTKALESPLKASSSSSSSTPTAQLPNLPLFTTEKENGIGERLSLSTEAQQVISSLTSLLKRNKKSDERPSQDGKWSSSRSDVSDEDPLQKMRKELKEKNRERERKEALSHKRPHSPEPPPPPPSKKHNPGLRLQIPPPPPPKTKADTRPGDASGESTPVKLPNPAGATTPVRTPGSAGIYPQQLGKSYPPQASGPFHSAPVKAPFQQPFQAQQYAQQQQQQPQQPQQPQQGYNPSYPVYDYNHQNSHGTSQPFAPYHQGQQAPLPPQQGPYQPPQQQQQQPPQTKQGYPNAYPQPLPQQQGYNPAAVAVPPPPQPQQPQQYPAVSSNFGSNQSITSKASYGQESRTTKPSFPANANSYSPRRVSYYQK